MKAAPFRPCRLAAVALLAASASASGAGIRLPDGPGVNLLYSRCQTCHDLQYVKDSAGLAPAQWESVLAGMRDYGLEISDQDKSEILKYLTTYLGTSPPPAPAAAPVRVAGGADGQAVWAQNCAACHGAEGAGQPGYFPPLSGNADLYADRVFPVLVVLNGMSGPVTVAGRSYNGSMPGLGHLSDEEIAAVIRYVRGAWDNASHALPFEPVTADLVADQRRQPMTAVQVHALRGKLLQAGN